MKQTLLAGAPSPVHVSVDALVAEHGAWPVLRRALRGLLVPRRGAGPVASIEMLDDRLRRDIGLPARPPAAVRWHDLR